MDVFTAATADPSWPNLLALREAVIEAKNSWPETPPEDCNKESLEVFRSQLRARALQIKTLTRELGDALAERLLSEEPLRLDVVAEGKQAELQLLVLSVSPTA